MANYNLVINSRFSPFSYQELLAPVLQATQAHQALEEAYNNIDTQGESIGSKINKDLDPTAYKRYQDYKQALDAQADELAKHGLNVGSRRALFKVRSDFAKNIMPIQEAITRRRQLAEEQRKASLSNPTLFFQRDFTTLNDASSLDRFLENPEYDYGDRASGALIEQQVGEAVSNLKTWLRSKGRLKGVGIPYQYEQLVQYGFKPEEILNAIQNPSEGDPILTKIVNDTLQASGILDWGSPQQIKEATAFANRGLWKSVGETKIQNYTDQYGMSSALAREAEARAAAREAARAANDDLIRNSGIPIDLQELTFPGDSDNPAMSLVKGTTEWPATPNSPGVTHLRRVDKNAQLMFSDLGIPNEKGAKLGNNRRIDVPVGFQNGTTFYNFYYYNKPGSHSHNFSTLNPSYEAQRRIHQTQSMQLWDGNGKILSKNQFINQKGNNLAATNNLNWYWDKKIVPFLRAAGFSDKQIIAGNITKKDLAAARDNIYTMGSPKSMHAVAISLTDNNKAMERVLGRTSQGDKVSIYKVTGVDNNGTILHNNKKMNLDDFRDDEDKILGNPQFFAAPNGQILIKTTGDDNAGMYVVDTKAISQNLGKSAQINMDNLQRLQAQKQRAIQYYMSLGMDSQEAMEAFALSRDGRLIDQAIDQYGGAFVKSIANAISWEAKNPTYNTVTSGE